MSQLKAINEGIIRLELPNINPRIIACSAETKFGIDVVKCRVLEAIQESRQRNIDKREDLLLDYIKNMRVTPINIDEKQKQLSKQYVVRKLIYNSKLTKYLV